MKENKINQIEKIKEKNEKMTDIYIQCLKGIYRLKNTFDNIKSDPTMVDDNILVDKNNTEIIDKELVNYLLKNINYFLNDLSEVLKIVNNK